jgi:hypothetical protein
MHAIHFAVAIGIKFCFHPQIMPDPGRLVIKCVYYLSLTVFKNGFGFGRLILCYKRQIQDKKTTK